MAKYIIDVPASFVDITNGLHIPMDKQGNFRIDTGLKLIPYTEPDRKAIEDEVWKFAQKFTHESKAELNAHERMEIWGTASCDKIINDFTYSEAKEKYEVWKKRKEEIHVGDEVETESGNKACVLCENPDGTQMFVFKADGTPAWWSKCSIHKTGKNHSEVKELLKKMRDTE